MKAVILAAGIASRLRPLTNHTPKCLLEIGGKSLLERAIQGLLTNNIREIVLVTGYLQEQIVSFVQKKFPEVDVKFIYNKKYATTNNIYSLWLVKNSIQGEDIVLLDSDILFDPGLVTAVFAELDHMILKEDLGNVFYEAAFQRLIAQGKSFHIVDTSTLFSMELDTLEDFQTATEKLPANLL